MVFFDIIEYINKYYRKKLKMTKEQEILANRIKNKRQHSLNVIDEIMSSVKITELRAVTNKEETEIIFFI